MKGIDRSWLLIALGAAHLAALVFGLVGLLIMLPNPELWQDDPRAVRIFTWSMEHAGATHIILGAATMFVFGVFAIGWWKTTSFAVLSFTLSLGFELIGTGTGWPFGNYAYTSFLGYKVLGHVPYTVPLSWFYMGFASYLLAGVLMERFSPGRHMLWRVALGSWLLMVWDLVLDPAMAHESLMVQFWVWDETGPYFGMPIKNFVGWWVTGLVFMLVSRLVWRKDADVRSFSLTIPVVMYAANMAFAMVLSASVGLWIPVFLAVILGLVPAALAVWNHPRLPELRLGSLQHE